MKLQSKHYYYILLLPIVLILALMVVYPAFVYDFFGVMVIAIPFISFLGLIGAIMDYKKNGTKLPLILFAVLNVIVLIIYGLLLLEAVSRFG
jgi:hypothetical protein